MSRKLGKFRLPIARLKPLHEVPIPLRGRAAELLVEYQLCAYYMKAEKPLKDVAVGDRVAVLESKDGTTKRIPVEIKSVTIENFMREIHVSKGFLRKFKGVYIVIYQLKKDSRDYDFLIFTDEEMRREIFENGELKRWNKAHKEKRWHLKIPDGYKGFKEYLDKWDKIIG